MLEVGIDLTPEGVESLKIPGVYKIENIKTGARYIGESVDIYNRWQGHIRELDNNEHCRTVLQKDWNQQGRENFVFTLVEQVEEGQKERLRRERWWQYQTWLEGIELYAPDRIVNKLERWHSNLDLYRPDFHRWLGAVTYKEYRDASDAWRAIYESAEWAGL